jgi:hypothetical protein
MAAFCDCGGSACRARSEQAEHRRLAPAPSASPLLAGLRGRPPAAPRKDSSNQLNQLLSAALLGLGAAPAECTAAGSRRSASKAPYRLGLSLTGGAATKTALSQRRGLPPPLCRPCHGVPPWSRFTSSDSACPAARHPNRTVWRLSPRHSSAGGRTCNALPVRRKKGALDQAAQARLRRAETKPHNDWPGSAFSE